MSLFGLKTFVTLCFFNIIGQVLLFQCKDEDNKDVDWYIIYKLPQISKTANRLLQNGTAYVYMDENNNWIYPEKSISSLNNSLSYTLAPLYDNENIDKSLWFLYSDEPPGEPIKNTGGYAKGVVMVNKNNGFWLIHSIPKFPAPPDYGNNESKANKNNNIPISEYTYNVDKYAETLLCISLSNDQFNKIGKQLRYNEINVFSKNMPDSLYNKFYTLAQATDKWSKESPPYNSKANFNSINGKQFTSFAKGSKWNNDLYKDYLGLEFNDNLETETWRLGPSRLYPECDTFRNNVYDIFKVSFSHLNLKDFNETQDHGKWAITSDYNTIVCIADVDRDKTQYRRGGGAVCMNDNRVWSEFHNIIKEISRCELPWKDEDLKWDGLKYDVINRKLKS